MAKTLSERQRDYRQRKAAEPARMRDALERIIARLEGNEKPLAVEIRQIAREGLTGS